MRLTISTLLLFTVLFVKAQQGASSFEFVENKGQWENGIKFKGATSTGAFFLQQKGFTVLLHNPSDLASLSQKAHEHGGTGVGPIKEGEREIDKIGGIRSTAPDFILHSHAYSVQFSGASEKPTIVPDKVQSYHNNYFIGNDPTKWASNVKIFQAVTYQNVYPNIDVRYYSDYGRLKYDFVVRPGGDVSKIVMKYQGVDKLSIRNKELIIRTSVGELKELYPYSYSVSKGMGKQEVDCRYEISGNNTVTFKIKNYDASSTLVIDPTLIFSTFTGGPDNYGFTATPGPDGSLFSGCIVFSDGFPVTLGAFQTVFNGGNTSTRPTDIGIIKFNPTATTRLYATYIGGNGNDFPHSLYCDPQGNLVVMGRSYSTNYPGTALGVGGGSDIIVSKLNATGSALIGSLRIGGSSNDGVNILDHFQTNGSGSSSILRNYGDESRSEVVLDAAGNIYVAATTLSANFPINGTVFQPTKGTLQDGVVMKINPSCTSLLWSSFLGGTGDDGAFVMEIDPDNGDVYVAGATGSSNFPVSPSGVIQTLYQGDISDGFVTVINNNGSAIKKSTFLGTSGIDVVYGIKFDKKGFPYVMGTCRNGNWPVQPAGVWSVPGTKQFVAKLQPDLSGYVYSTVFGAGGKPNISPVAFLVDRCENVYISGWGGWLIPNSTPDPYDLGGVVGMPITPDAIKKATDDKDLYFIVIKKNASGLLYGSYFGQDGGYGEHVDGGTSRFDAQGVIYQAICANCSGGAVFPTTPGVVSPQNGASTSGGCNLAAIKIAFNFAGVASGPKAYLNGVQDTAGCVPLTFEFRDTVLNAKTYDWDFGDGTVLINQPTPSVSHTYNVVGNYRVRLIAVDSNTCNIRDTAYINVRVRDDKANIGFNPVKLPPCESLSYRFDNTSLAPPGKPFNNTSFIWDFGDGTRVPSGSGSVTHAYVAAGTYKVRLILADTVYCNSPDSVSVDLRIAPNVDARFETPASGCLPYNAVFNNTSLAGQTFSWDFGDGTTSTLTSPTHLYTTAGTYTVKMIATDLATCNVIDSVETTITVNVNPVANFSFNPVTPEINKPTIFFNLATGGTRYKWVFGDGDSTIKTTTDTVLHQYNATGTYTACQIVYNQFGCSDTICKPVSAIVQPLLAVPNAFTPGRFGTNSTIRVEGFGIAKMTWRIYNRWGQKVFETSDRKFGWDGTYKGQIQPMDVYAYTLDVEFFDGTKARKTGDITLIK